MKPAWQGKLKPVVKEFDLKTFGATVQNRPAIANNKDKVDIQSNGVTMPRFDIVYCLHFAVLGRDLIFMICQRL